MALIFPRVERAKKPEHHISGIFSLPPSSFSAVFFLRVWEKIFPKSHKSQDTQIYVLPHLSGAAAAADRGGGFTKEI